MKRWLGLYARGMSMGAADVVPGVSGGTLALITGIYEELIETLARIDLRLLRVWRREGFAAFWRIGNFGFLFTVLAGIVTSIALFARLIIWLLDNCPVPLWSFFCGLILASIWVVLRPVRRFDAGIWAGLLLAFALAWWTGTLPGLRDVAATGLWRYFLSGAVAICAMILPGISGSFILVLLGMYQPVLTAVREFDLPVILTFLAGCVVGLLLFVHLIRWLLHRFHDPVMVALAGFMAGSINKLWPWQVNVAGSAAKENLLPGGYAAVTGASPMVAAAVLAALSGVVIVVTLTWFGDRRAGISAH